MGLDGGDYEALVRQNTAIVSPVASVCYALALHREGSGESVTESKASVTSRVHLQKAPSSVQR